MDSHKVDSLRAYIALGKQFDYPEDRLQALGEQWPKLEKRALPGLGTDLTPAVAEEIVLRLAAALREHNPGWAYPTEVLDAFLLLIPMWTQIDSAKSLASVLASALSKDNEADSVFYPAFDRIRASFQGTNELNKVWKCIFCGKILGKEWIYSARFSPGPQFPYCHEHNRAIAFEALKLMATYYETNPDVDMMPREMVGQLEKKAFETMIDQCKMGKPNDVIQPPDSKEYSQVRQRLQKEYDKRKSICLSKAIGFNDFAWGFFWTPS